MYCSKIVFVTWQNIASYNKTFYIIKTVGTIYMVRRHTRTLIRSVHYPLSIRLRFMFSTLHFYVYIYRYKLILFN
jgi:hypothetical protein